MAICQHCEKGRPTDVLLDDFEIPIRLLARGKRTVFEPTARAYDAKSIDWQHEFNRKSRTLAGNIQSFARNPWLFNPRKNPVWWQFLSHKVFRLLIPVAMLGAACSGWTPREATR